MSTQIFPRLIGQGWSVTKQPGFATRIQRAVSGRELRTADMPYPVWNFTVTFTYLPTADLNTLLAFFLARQGSFDTFLYDDPTDNTVTGGYFGTGTGSATVYQLERAIVGSGTDNYFFEPVVAPEYGGGDLLQRGGAGPVGLHRRPGDRPRHVHRAAPVRGRDHERFHFLFPLPVCRRCQRVREFHGQSVAAQKAPIPFGADVKPFSAGLDGFLAGWGSSSSVYMADLYTLVLTGGEVFRFSGAQTALATDLFAPGSVNDGQNCTFALGPRFARTQTKTDIGVQVSELDIEIYAGDTDRLGDLTWQQAARMGIFDGAALELDRAFMQPYGTVQGTTILFYGRTGEISLGRSKIEMKAVDLKDLLKIQMPRRLYQAGCNHVFGDAMCGVDRTATAVTFACVAGSSQSQIATGFAPSPPTLFNQGTLTGVTGQNAGATRTVIAVSTGTGNIAFLLKALLFPVAIGDQFTLLPGCDHTVATCQGSFNNLSRFGGFPYIPPPEAAI